MPQEKETSRDHSCAGTTLAYSSPSLTLFGSLGELTASGSNGPSESVGSTMICGLDFMFNSNCV